MADGRMVDDGDAMPFQFTGQRHGRPTVPRRQQPVFADQHGDIGPGGMPHGSEFDGDRPGADNDRTGRELVACQRLRGIDERPAERLARQRLGLRAGSQHHMIRVDDQRLPGVLRDCGVAEALHLLLPGTGGDGDRGMVRQFGLSMDDRDLAMGKQTGQSFGHRVDHAQPVIAQRAIIHAVERSIDAKLLGASDCVDGARGGQQCLGRDAPAVQACAAECGVPFNQHNGFAELRGSQCGGVSARPGPDDDDVGMFTHMASSRMTRRAAVCAGLRFRLQCLPV